MEDSTLLSKKGMTFMCFLNFRNGKSFMFSIFPTFCRKHVIYWVFVDHFAALLRHEMGQIFLDFPEEPT